MKLYRGYNKDYPNWGIRPNQNYIWTTDDIDYALKYTKLFDNGGLVEFDVDVNQLNLADDYDGEELFGDEWYDFGGLIDADNDMIQVFIDNGFNSALLDNSGIDCYLLFDKKLIKSAKELPLNNIENKLNESYQLFKNIYLKEHTGFIVRETPASYLTYIKNYIQKVLDYEPNANNYPFITEDKKYYWDRIAGYYNVDTKEFIYISPDETHQNEEEFYEKNYVRFFIADIKHRALYVSHIDYNIAYKGYKAIKEKYKDFGIEYSVVEWYENNDWKEITFDDKGHKVKITQIYEEFKKYVMPLYEQHFNKEINEVLRIAGVQRLNESWTDSNNLYNIYENYTPYNVLVAFKEGEKNIWFPLIKPTEYKQALLEFMKMGELVRFPKDKVFKWLEIIMKNTCILSSNTFLAGHEMYFPFDDIIDAYPEAENLEQDYYVFSKFLEDKGFYNWCKLPDGSPAWSDYGLKPLWNILDEYKEDMTIEQVLVLVNRCLDVYHQQGDLASAFIEGGSSSLTKISNECVKNNGNIINESYLKTYNGIIYYTKSENVFINTINARFKNIPIRVIYDLKNRLYVFGDANKFVHTQMMNYILVNTKLYSTKGWNQSYFNEDGNYWRDGYIEDNLFNAQCALFQIIWDDDIEKYTKYDGYDTGYFTTIDNKMYVVCRQNELKYCEKVPLLWNNHWFSQKYDNMKDFQLNESIFGETLGY